MCDLCFARSFQRRPTHERLLHVAVSSISNLIANSEHPRHLHIVVLPECTLYIMYHWMFFFFAIECFFLSIFRLYLIRRSWSISLHLNTVGPGCFGPLHFDGYIEGLLYRGKIQLKNFLWDLKILTVILKDRYIRRRYIEVHPILTVILKDYYTEVKYH